jgi:hypothetical protein
MGASMETRFLVNFNVDSEHTHGTVAIWSVTFTHGMHARAYIDVQFENGVFVGVRIDASCVGNSCE